MIPMLLDVITMDGSTYYIIPSDRSIWNYYIIPSDRSIWNYNMAFNLRDALNSICPLYHRQELRNNMKYVTDNTKIIMTFSSDSTPEEVIQKYA